MPHQTFKTPFNILILGASYGSLLAIKFLAAGHHVTMTCRTATSALINAEGIRVRLPIKGRKDLGIGGLLEIDSRTLPGQLHASTPQLVGDLSRFDLVVLAMQEPQYRQDGIRQLMACIAQAGLPCMPIMNMPPLPYLARLQQHNAQLDVSACSAAYADPCVWKDFNPALMTLSSPDPQAFRPVDEPVNVLQVALPTNFKVARFESDDHTQMLRQLESDIEAIRFDVKGEPIELPVKLKVFATDPMAAYFLQPGRKDVKVDAINATMKRAAYVKLGFYPESRPPVELYPGKMWRSTCWGSDVICWLDQDRVRHFRIIKIA